MSRSCGLQPQNRATLARSLHGLGEVLASQGRDADAEQAFRKALDIQRRVLGPAHADIARTLQDLALVLDDAGDLKAAIPMMREAVNMQRALNGSQSDPGLALAIHNLAELTCTRMATTTGPSSSIPKLSR